MDGLAQIEDGSVDCVLTDPPYNVGKDFGNGAAADRRDDYEDWLWKIWADCGRVAKEGSFLITTNRIAHLPMGFSPPDPWRFFHVAIWHKPLALAGCWYGIAPHWEPIFIYVKGEKPWRDFRGPEVRSDVLQASVQTVRRGHPTEKPEALWGPLLRFGCPPGGLVLDPFAGSGTTGAVAVRLGMSAILIDVNPAYCAMMRERLAQGALL